MPRARDAAHDVVDPVVLVVQLIARVADRVDVGVRLEDDVDTRVIVEQSVTQLLDLAAKLVERHAAPAVVPVADERDVHAPHRAMDVALVARAP